MKHLKTTLLSTFLIFGLSAAAEDTPQENHTERIKVVIFNDNLGSKGNDTGLTHGLRLVYSMGPEDGENWSVALESRLYISKISIKTSGKAEVYPVERNSFEFNKKIPVFSGAYIILGASGGWTTNIASDFMIGGSKDQQNLFHDLFNDLSNDIMDYEYKNECYKKTASLFAKSHKIKSRRSVRAIRDFENELKKCDRKGKTSPHLGLKFAFGKMILLNEAQNVCRKPYSVPGCRAYLKIETGLDSITVKDDSTVYLFSEINQPLFFFGKESALSAIIRLGAIRRISEGNPEWNQSWGFQWLSESPRGTSILRLDVTKPKNSLGRFFDVPNDDDSIIYLSYEMPFD